MTPEDTFLTIEDALRHVTQMQERHQILGDHEAEIREIRQLHNNLMVALDRAAEAQRTNSHEVNALLNAVNVVVQKKERDKH
jgi:hypothetical protein